MSGTALRACAGGASALAALLVAGAASAAPDISDVWWAKTYSLALRPMDGSPLPLTAQGRAKFEASRAAIKRDKKLDTGKYLCTPIGVPRAMLTAYPIQILQTPQQTTIFLEQNRDPRIVKMTGKHADPKFWDPSYMGESIGHWEGDTLVIDTTNFNPKTFIDGTGLPHSDKLHVVERLRPVDGGKRLVDEITVDDPVMFTHPWKAQVSFERRPDIRIRTDWICGEPHRDISSVKLVAQRSAP
jgi:hypothetical protein